MVIVLYFQDPFVCIHLFNLYFVLYFLLYFIVSSGIIFNLSFDMYFRIGLLMINLPNFFFFGPETSLFDIQFSRIFFTKYKIMHWHFSSRALKMHFHCLITFIISVKKSTVSFNAALFKLLYIFKSLTTYKIFSIFFRTFIILILDEKFCRVLFLCFFGWLVELFCLYIPQGS